ncbi:MAG: VCBS repeat-containing protein [Phycisphaerales bacterium]|nr:VCBS repeat-containing protein [Phycisphaerales bacterium]
MRLILAGEIAAMAALAVAGLDAAPSPPPDGSLRFNPPVPYEVSSSEPKDVVAGYFNNDEFLDLAVSSGPGKFDDVVSIMLGDRRGGFAENRAYTTALGPRGLTTADFNHDSIPDLAVTAGGRDAATVHILLGRGNAEGDFRPAADLPTGVFPIAVAADDFNHDTHVDLAVANNVYGGVLIYLGYGDGTFAAGAGVPGSGNMGTDIAVGYFNGDEHADLVFAHYYGLTTFMGLGDGTFSIGGAAGSGYLTQSVTVGDLDVDGHADIACAELYMNRMVVSWGRGDGTFTPGPMVTIGSFLMDLKIARINADAHPDVVVAFQDGDQAVVIRGAGGRSLSAPLAFDAGIQPAAVVVGDFNGDRFADLALPFRNWGDAAFVSILTQVPPPPRVHRRSGGQRRLPVEVTPWP